MFVSDQLWNDANYALSEGTYPRGWREVTLGDTATRAELARMFGAGMPTHPGEYVEYSGAELERAALAAGTWEAGKIYA
jgi:hypothetical protein